MIRMWEEESIQRQEEEEDQVCDEVGEEEESSVCPPFVLQQTGHHWVFEEVIAFVLHLQHNRRKQLLEIDTISMVTIVLQHHLNLTRTCRQFVGPMQISQKHAD